ncbi:DUF2309 domain-containing protein [Nannocystis bainbridge]|uniref:Probable inorganic carbon transporter subunit DabA n=1 Tax=Nannocystis bainbridge TaxID=2995303 RepID=A0ABT5EAZ3_9BACT|nr:DUF2309 domain-containing protein [Nannocystis bainbridge]MDC0723036.1 DUF2309 domain-containing protein [Nannocystis bainbridge]
MSTATAHPLSFDAPPQPAARPDVRERLQAALEHASHYLPAQAPLEVFVHHNTLHAFQHLPFHAAIREAQTKLRVRGYLTKETYRELLASGRIREDDLDAVLADERFPGEPIAPGFPSRDVAAALVIRHGVGAETIAHLRWNLVEKDAANRFDGDIRQGPRDAIVRSTRAWLEQEVAAAGGPAGAREVAAKVVSPTPGERALDPLRKLGALLGRRVDPRDLMGAFACNPELFSVRALWTACVRACEHLEGQPCPQDTPAVFHRDLLLRTSGEDPNDLVHAHLIPLCAAFLDRGQSYWTMPDRERGFFRAWSKVLSSGLGVRPAWLAGLGERLRDWDARKLGAEDVVVELLAELGIADDELAAFVEHTLLQLPGWAGMFHRLESAPGPIGRTRAQVHLIDYMAVRLTLDLFAYCDVGARLGLRGQARAIRAACAGLPQISGPKQRGRHDTSWPLFRLCQLAGVSAATIYAASRADVEAVLAFLDELDEPTRLRVLHEAYERRYRVELLDALAANLAAPPPVTTRPRHQVVFCIDDRFESSRRHLEEIAPECETLGAAGFFGLAIAYQGIDDPSTFPLCPVVVEPQHRIEEQALTRQFSIAELRASRRRQLGEIETAWGRMSRSLLLGSIVTAVAGFFAAIPLLASVFSPRAAGRMRKAIARWWLPEPMTRLTELRAEQDGTRTAQVMSGFTLDEMATRVASLLENMGIVHRFGKLIVVLGHDSSSVNNPYFPAYSCGACGGRSGGPNARLFARMANQSGVRERLAARGIEVPADTVFVGGLYDTANDMIRLYDAEDLPDAALLELRVLSPQLEEMCRRNAHERCRRFAAAPRRASPERDQRHVEGRAFDLAQARPELGHATNAACFVGRRPLTAGLFLDRRAFLVSYDPEQDPKGAILERILLAVGPVGAGINLEYFFSTVDAERLGAGTKLPHNVTGLFGVMNGASSDLRTGLPRQMTEIHEPVRLHLVVEATPATLLAIAGRQPIVAELVTNEWLRLCAVDPDTRAIQVFDARFGFRPYTPVSAGLPRVARSGDWYAGRDGFLPPALIRP